MTGCYNHKVDVLYAKERANCETWSSIHSIVQPITFFYTLNLHTNGKIW